MSFGLDDSTFTVYEAEEPSNEKSNVYEASELGICELPREIKFRDRVFTRFEVKREKLHNDVEVVHYMDNKGCIVSVIND